MITTLTLKFLSEIEYKIPKKTKLGEVVCLVIFLTLILCSLTIDISLACIAVQVAF